MRSFSERRTQTIFAITVALLSLCNIQLVNGEKIQLYKDDGAYFTITITGGGCFDFKNQIGWDKAAIAGDILDGSCFEVWDAPGCRGESRKLNNGAEELRDFKMTNFDKKTSSVSLCPPKDFGSNSTNPNQTNPNQTNPSTNREAQGGPKPLEGTSLQQVRDVAVVEHNKYRTKHGAPPLQGNASMHEEAQKYSEYLASSNKFELNLNSKFIGNIGSSFRRNPEDAIKDIVARWYDAVKFYDFNNPVFSGQAGPFTAIVWKSSTDMGIGAGWNQVKNNWVIISYYSPSPNIQGAFKENVLPIKS